MVTLAVIALLVVVGLYVVSTYNALIGLRNKVDEAFSTMDVFLKKRFDQIPNLVATVKGYAKHEAETLERVIKLRQGAVTTDDKVEAEKQMSSALRQLLVSVEAYPELKADAQFQELMHSIKDVEVDIANARRYYNGSVRQYNDKIQMVPSNFVANIFGFTARQMYEVDSAEERKNIKVEF